MGLPDKGHSLRRTHKLPVAKGTGAAVASAQSLLEFFQHPAALPRSWNPLDALSCVEEGFTSSVVTH